MTKKPDHSPADAPCEHCGIFSVPGSDAIQGAWRDITYSPVRDRIWTASEGIYRSVFVEGRRGILAFDTFSTPGGARAYRGAMQRVFPRKPVHTIVYSHDHLDHSGYAADLAPEADIVAHDLCNRVIAGRKSDGQIPANEVWSGERRHYDIDGIEFELIYPGPTHGDGNVAAWFPSSGLLFMVDTVIPGVGYTFFPDWHLSPYVPAMRRLLELDWDIFVPGHFWVTDRAGFIANLDYYDRMAEHAQKAIAAGYDPDEKADITAYTREHLAPEFGHLFRFDEYATLNLARYMHHYLTGGWGIEGNMSAPDEPL
ncbi:MAG: MBL fold metallo-hydrolase [Xanthomonadales bacterium]|nr:MBL fold metallo-hydrolase [Xanthomonadales bacterium]